MIKIYILAEGGSLPVSGGEENSDDQLQGSHHDAPLSKGHETSPGCRGNIFGCDTLIKIAYFQFIDRKLSYFIGNKSN